MRTYGGYISARTKLARHATRNSTADNFLSTPATVDVPGVGTVDPGQLTALNLNTRGV